MFYMDLCGFIWIDAALGRLFDTPPEFRGFLHLRLRQRSLVQPSSLAEKNTQDDVIDAL